MFDILVATTGLLLLLPMMIVIAISIKLTSPGPLIYQAERIGRHGKPFKLLKWRSMIVHADQIGPSITIANDQRITPIGKILRSTKLDELPQLINVLKGDMSIVGPRPESPVYVSRYTAEQRKVLSVRPGITSPASIRFRHEERLLNGADWEAHYIEHIMPQKLALDLDYARRATLWRDIQIILYTLWVIILPYATRIK